MCSYQTSGCYHWHQLSADKYNDQLINCIEILTGYDEVSERIKYLQRNLIQLGVLLKAAFVLLRLNV